MIGDFERIADHAVNILESAEELRDKKLRFTEDALSELTVVSAASVFVLILLESLTEILTVSAERAQGLMDVHIAVGNINHAPSDVGAVIRGLAW